MIRKIIEIDTDKCIGCGLCAEACHEGAIAVADGKARLMRENFCDGLGDCLPACPTDAIHFVEREAAAYDAAAVQAAKHEKLHAQGGCPGAQMRQMQRGTAPQTQSAAIHSELQQWPCQIQLVPVNAAYFSGADLLIAADCTAYAYANLHAEFMRGKITLIGCPKLDKVDYGEKLLQILRENDIKSVTVVRMEVPCCGGLEAAAKSALLMSGKTLPWQVVTVSIDGHLLDR